MFSSETWSDALAAQQQSVLGLLLFQRLYLKTEFGQPFFQIQPGGFTQFQPALGRHRRHELFTDEPASLRYLLPGNLTERFAGTIRAQPLYFIHALHMSLATFLTCRNRDVISLQLDITAQWLG